MTQTNDGIYVSPLSGLIFRAGMEFKNWRDFWPYYTEAWLLGWPENEMIWYQLKSSRAGRGIFTIDEYFKGENPKVTITLEDIPQQTYEETPKSFDFAACAAGMKRGEEWLARGTWISISATLFTDLQYIPEALLDILKARKAAEALDEVVRLSQEIGLYDLPAPEAIPPEPQGMDLHKAWKSFKQVWFPWPESGLPAEWVDPGSDLSTFIKLKTIADRFGGKPFYLTEEEAQAHAEWLVKYGEKQS